jgi:class 3 adenylate cyclase
MGGPGHSAYPLIGDAINVESRLQGEAPVGGVLIGEETGRQLPPSAIVAPRHGLRVKGTRAAVDAFVLRSLPHVSSRAR